MIERSVLDILKDKLQSIQEEIQIEFSKLESDVDYEFNGNLGREVSTNFDSSDLEELKENLKGAISNLENIVSEIDGLDL